MYYTDKHLHLSFFTIGFLAASFSGHHYDRWIFITSVVLFLELSEAETFRFAGLIEIL